LVFDRENSGEVIGSQRVKDDEELIGARSNSLSHWPEFIQNAISG
jgi:hypothetical protein